MTIKIFHLHKDVTRNYAKPIHPPWGLVMPAYLHTLQNMSTLGIDVKRDHRLSSGFKNFSFSNSIAEFFVDSFRQNFFHSFKRKSIFAIDVPDIYRLGKFKVRISCRDASVSNIRTLEEMACQAPS